jgi:hypothetical protein
MLYFDINLLLTRYKSNFRIHKFESADETDEENVRINWTHAVKKINVYFVRAAGKLSSRLVIKINPKPLMKGFLNELIPTTRAAISRMQCHTKYTKSRYTVPIHVFKI